MSADLDVDSEEIATLWQHGCRGVVQDGAEVVAYFDRQIEVPVAGRWEPVDEVDWLDAYFAGLEPVDVGPLVVAPTHLDATLRAGQKPLWLDPGMAFGTGHHETTRMILRGLGTSDLRGRSVLDVGSGSGILAIAADLLGACDALGIDNDPHTVPVARANADLNRSRARFAVATLDDRPRSRCGPTDLDRAGEEDGWDVIAANLFAELHVAFMGAYASMLAVGGALWLSGIADDKLDPVLAAVAAPVELVDRSSEGPWWCLELRKI